MEQVMRVRLGATLLVAATGPVRLLRTVRSTEVAHRAVSESLDRGWAPADVLHQYCYRSDHRGRQLWTMCAIVSATCVQ
jgi:hypothetical protein